MKEKTIADWTEVKKSILNAIEGYQNGRIAQGKISKAEFNVIIESMKSNKSTNEKKPMISAVASRIGNFFQTTVETATGYKTGIKRSVLLQKEIKSSTTHAEFYEILKKYIDTNVYKDKPGSLVYTLYIKMKGIFELSEDDINRWERAGKVSNNESGLPDYNLMFQLALAQNIRNRLSEEEENSMEMTQRNKQG